MRTWKGEKVVQLVYIIWLSVVWKRNAAAENATNAANLVENFCSFQLLSCFYSLNFYWFTLNTPFSFTWSLTHTLPFSFQAQILCFYTLFHSFSSSWGNSMSPFSCFMLLFLNLHVSFLIIKIFNYACLHIASAFAPWIIVVSSYFGKCTVSSLV